MNSDVKLIISCLNSEPFNRKYNLISFDSASPQDLTQILQEVLAQINEQDMLIDPLEDAEQMMKKVVNCLRILKYKPADNLSSSDFRQGLASGDKKIIYPILEWLLRNLPELKKRAYLAQFLVKVEIPLEILANVDTAALYDQYEKLIEEFKTVHKENVTSSRAKINIAELRADLDAMQREKDIVLKKIDHLKKKTENLPEKEAIFNESRLLRKEKENRKELMNQISNETSLLQQYEQKQMHAIQQLQELKQATQGMTLEGVMQKLSEEKELSFYLTEEKLPREIVQIEKETKILESVVRGDNISRDTVMDISSKIEEVNQDINRRIEKHLASTDPVDEKLAPYRQQAIIISQKKIATSEQFNALKNSLTLLETELKEKERKIKEILGEEMLILKEEDFKKYINKLKTRSALYKKYRLDLSVIKTEKGILARTLDLLMAKGKKLNANFDEPDLDTAKTDSHGQGETVVKRNIQDVNELAALMSQLHSQIAATKANITPNLEYLKPLLKECKELSLEHEENKNTYNRKSAILDRSILKLKQEVKTLQEERDVYESEKKLILAQSIIAKVDLQRMRDESQLYLNQNKTEPTLKEKLNEKITENEREGKLLKEEQQNINQTQIKLLKQQELWTNLETLFNLKHKCMEKAKKKDGVLYREEGAETLILQ